MAFNLKTFTTRATTAFIFVAVLLSCVWYSYVSFVIFFAVVGFIGLHEFFNLSKKLNAKPTKSFGYLLHLIAVTTILFYPFINKPYLNFLPYLIILMSSSLFIVELFNKTLIMTDELKAALKKLLEEVKGTFKA